MTLSEASSDEDDDAGSYARVGEGLTKIPSEIVHLTNLSHLNLHGNGISHLAHLHRLAHLRHLNLSSNNITSLGTALCHCSTLRVLNLSSNQLQVCLSSRPHAHVGVRLVQHTGPTRPFRPHQFDQPAPGTQLHHLPARSRRVARRYLVHYQLVVPVRSPPLPIGRLQHLDLRNNALSDIQQLSHLAGLCSLRTLLFAGPRGQHACPLTATPQYRYAAPLCCIARSDCVVMQAGSGGSAATSARPRRFPCCAHAPQRLCLAADCRHQDFFHRQRAACCRAATTDAHLPGACLEGRATYSAYVSPSVTQQCITACYRHADVYTLLVGG